MKNLPQKWKNIIVFLRDWNKKIEYLRNIVK